MENLCFTRHGIKKGLLQIHHLLNESRNLLLRFEFRQKHHGVSVDFLTYNGLLSAIPDAWKKSIHNLEETLNNSDEPCNLTSVNVTAKIAHKMFILKIPKTLKVEVKLVEQNSNFLVNGNRLVVRKAIRKCHFKCYRYFKWL